MSFPPFLLLFLFFQQISGLSIDSRLNLEDNTELKSIPTEDEITSPSEFVLFRPERNSSKVVFEDSTKSIETESRSAGLSIQRGKPAPTEPTTTVPIIRGTNDFSERNIAGLTPPSQRAPVFWRPAQYQDSNGYYPNVGNPYTTTIRPIYGPPNNCPSYYGPNQGWPNNPNYPNQNYPNGNRPNYPSNPNQPNYPSNPNQPPNYPYPNYPNPTQQPNYPNQNPNYPNYPGQSWPNNYPNQNWQKQTNSGQWHPCKPFELNNNQFQGRRNNGCPEDLINVTPVNNIDGKAEFDKEYDEVNP